jgi:hypothetical protein
MKFMGWDWFTLRATPQFVVERVAEKMAEQARALDS